MITIQCISSLHDDDHFIVGKTYQADRIGDGVYLVHYGEHAIVDIAYEFISFVDGERFLDIEGIAKFKVVE